MSRTFRFNLFGSILPLKQWICILQHCLQLPIPEKGDERKLETSYTSKDLQEIVLRKGEISNNFEVVKEDFELVSSSGIVSPTNEPPSDEKPRNWRCSSQLKFSSWSKFVFNFGNTWLSPSSCTSGSHPCPFSRQSQRPRTSQGRCCTWIAPGFT